MSTESRDPAISAPPPDTPLEALLHQNAPAPVNDILLQRLRAARPDLSPIAAEKRRPGLAGFWKPLGVAAALTLGMWLLRETPGKPSHGAPAAAGNQKAGEAISGSGKASLDFLPSLESRQHLLRVRDLGVIRDSLQRPVQLMSTTWLDENTYGNPGSTPPLQESRLRHEIVPVLLPTY